MAATATPPINVVPLHANEADHGRLYLRPSDIVRTTGLSKSTVHHALATGELRGFRRGRAWLVPVTEVRRWIEGDTSASRD